MRVTDAVAATLAGLGADTVFGVVGSGNFHITNALISQGARYVAARHEGGAAGMADGWARTAGRTGLRSVHQKRPSRCVSRSQPSCNTTLSERALRCACWPH